MAGNDLSPSEKFRDRLKSGNLGGAYLFAGEEDYLKRYYLGELCRAAAGDEAFAAFNRVVFDGQEAQIGAIREAISSPPMMADWKLVEWRYPEIDRMKESERTALSELAALCREYPETVFAVIAANEAFDAGTVRRPSKSAQKLAKDFLLLNYEKSTDAQLLSWLKKHFDSEGIRVDARSLSFLIFRAGHGMTALAEETKKLSAYLKANGRDLLTVEDIAEITSPTDEFDAFALSNAITEKNREKAFAALHDMEQRKVDAGVAIAMLSRSFSEMATVSLLAEDGKDQSDIASLLHWNPYKAKICAGAAKRFGSEKLAEALGKLREADALSKSGGTSGYETLEIFLAEFL